MKNQIEITKLKQVYLGLVKEDDTPVLIFNDRRVYFNPQWDNYSVVWGGPVHGHRLNFKTAREVRGHLLALEFNEPVRGTPWIDDLLPKDSVFKDTPIGIGTAIHEELDRKLTRKAFETKIFAFTKQDLLENFEHTRLLPLMSKLSSSKEVNEAFYKKISDNVVGKGINTDELIKAKLESKSQIIELVKWYDEKKMSTMPAWKRWLYKIFVAY